MNAVPRKPMAGEAESRVRLKWHPVETAPPMEFLFVHWSVDQGFDGSFEIGTLAESGTWAYGWERQAARDCPRPTHWARPVPPAPPRRDVTERDRQIIEDYRAGVMMVRDIAQKHGFAARQSVTRIVRRDAPDLLRPVGRKSGPLRCNTERDRQIVEDYRAGMSSVAIAKKHGFKGRESALYIVKRDAPELLRRHAERDRQIVADYGAGMSSDATGEKHGLKGSSVLYILKRDAPEIIRRHGFAAGTRRKAAEALALRIDEGLTWTAIAERAGYSSAQAAWAAARRVAEARGLSWPLGPEAPDTTERDCAVVEDRRAGMTVKQIAARHGISGTTIKRIVRRLAPEIVRRKGAAAGGKAPPPTSTKRPPTALKRPVKAA